jgi:hypothetical protein
VSFIIPINIKLKERTCATHISYINRSMGTSL